MKYIFICTILFFFINSCVKDKHSTNVSIPKLRSLTIKWNYNSPNHDNIDFFYDNLNRVSSILCHHGSYEIPIAASDTIFKFLFFYNGINPFPYLSINADSYQIYPSGIYEYDYLFYDSKNKVIKDSTVNSLGQFAIRNYQYTDDNIILNSDTFGLSAGNFVSFKEGPDPRGFQYGWRVAFDDKINPLNSLNVSSVYNVVSHSTSPNFSEWSAWSLSNKNNQIED